MQVLLIVNSTASSVTERKRRVIESALATGHELTVVDTIQRGHATQLAQMAASDGTDIVVVLAGDGTLNEAAQGLVGTTTALAPLPGGSTNVYARTLGYSHDPIDATGQLLASLDNFNPRRVPVGSINGRYFLFHAGVGFDAAVIEQVEQASYLKRYAAHPLVLYKSVDTWLRKYDRDARTFTIELENGELIQLGKFAIISKTSPWTYLGSRPMKLAPDVGLESPLGLTVFHRLHMRTLLRMAGSALWGGKQAQQNPHVTQRRGLTKFQIHSNQPIHYQADGDFLGEASRFDVSMERAALSIVMP